MGRTSEQFERGSYTFYRRAVKKYIRESRKEIILRDLEGKHIPYSEYFDE